LCVELEGTVQDPASLANLLASEVVTVRGVKLGITAAYTRLAPKVWGEALNDLESRCIISYGQDTLDLVIDYLSERVMEAKSSTKKCKSEEVYVKSTRHSKTKDDPGYTRASRSSSHSTDGSEQDVQYFDPPSQESGSSRLRGPGASARSPGRVLKKDKFGKLEHDQCLALIHAHLKAQLDADINLKLEECTKPPVISLRLKAKVLSPLVIQL